MSFENIVRHLEQISIGTAQTGRHASQRITVSNEDLRLVKGDKVSDSIGESFRNDLRILRKPLNALRIQPAALFVQLIRYIPMK